ncbi:unnamed protein product [Polarella glacialis]|uniref:CMP/dCMP-type deaminase domain-containing protein n=1 Tax=Polarella glacialis TaxID=89957 RepID=A0A813DE42_POLGL|nr:unnamed protein product [Polarella glacialis]
MPVPPGPCGVIPSSCLALSRLAQEAAAAGGGPYGALIVDPSVGIIAEGHNHAAKNPIWHGEMAAISNLSDIISPSSVYSLAASLELYTSAEPCPMCMSAIAWSGFGRVVYGTSIPFIQEHGGSQIDLRARDVIAKSPKSVLLYEGFLHNETDPLYASPSVHRHDHDHTHRHLFGGLSFERCLHSLVDCPPAVALQQEKTW